jgi:hypothetical protein
MIQQAGDDGSGDDRSRAAEDFPGRASGGAIPLELLRERVTELRQVPLLKRHHPTLVLGIAAGLIMLG